MAAGDSEKRSQPKSSKGKNGANASGDDAALLEFEIDTNADPEIESDIAVDSGANSFMLDKAGATNAATAPKAKKIKYDVPSEKNKRPSPSAQESVSRKKSRSNKH
jgi:hypothetical protein